MDLESLQIDDLLALKREVEERIESYSGERREKAIAALHRVAHEHGFRLKDLVGVVVRRGRTTKGVRASKVPQPG